jgi:hypothetical protein
MKRGSERMWSSDFTRNGEHANPIEPSVAGKAKIGVAIARAVREHEFGHGRTEVFKLSMDAPIRFKQTSRIVLDDVQGTTSLAGVAESSGYARGLRDVGLDEPAFSAGLFHHPAISSSPLGSISAVTACTAPADTMMSGDRATAIVLEGSPRGQQARCLLGTRPTRGRSSLEGAAQSASPSQAIQCRCGSVRNCYSERPTPRDRRSALALGTAGDAAPVWA